MTGFKTHMCAKCGKKLEGANNGNGNSPLYNRCIKCGLKYCYECWQPEFIEVCPRCCGSCQ
ncbi:MAG: hypothetical protein CVU89_04850 [Firmicutes bacterium HGW-Firmicutes-14]|nr:MAG: hypothetical protein CVU89_04850 [Firmicutes bacterium HGW-Firmicutes-14]